MVGFGGVEKAGLALVDRAEIAAAGADVAHEHERRRAVFPALAHVRAFGLFANGVQLEFAEDVLQVAVTLPSRDALPNPRWQTPRRRLNCYQ